MRLLERLKRSLLKTRTAVSIGKFDPELLEEKLLAADFGSDASDEIIEAIKKIADKNNWKEAARKIVYESLIMVEKPIRYYKTPFVMMFVGINGGGKTTTIGKLAYQYNQAGRSVILAAADTYRAAATDQLEIWAKRSDAKIVKQPEGSDPSSVAFDACSSAKAKKADIVMIDTAGRLHTNENLTRQLVKMKRVIKKIDEDAPHEIILVIDSTIGRNSLIQAEQFDKALGLTGIVITKLDGTSKGGIIVDIAKELKIPIRYIGFGEKIEDLKAFDAKEFSNALI
ncbi:MAG: hypothetical protein IEMM0003_0012 [bacterium]|nr:MAG: hypothetical protein IEMM0003_0012 [bacterium]